MVDTADQFEPVLSNNEWERLVCELVLPIAIKGLRSIAIDLARVVAEAMPGEFRDLSMETDSADSIVRQHRRNMFVDDTIATKSDFDKRMNCLDEIARDFDPDDRSFVREMRRQHENYAKTLRQTVIRWLVPIILGALFAAGGLRLVVTGRTATPICQERLALTP